MQDSTDPIILSTLTSEFNLGANPHTRPWLRHSLMSQRQLVVLAAIGLALVGPLMNATSSWLPAAHAQILEEETQANEEQSDAQENVFGEANDDENDDLFGDGGENLFGNPPDEGSNIGEGNERPDDDEMVFPAGDKNGSQDANGKVALHLTGVKVSELAKQIAEHTRKPVWIDPLVSDTTITLYNKMPVTEQEAFDLIGIAIFEQRVAMIDRNSYIAIIPIANIKDGDAPIYGPDVDLLQRTDRGMVAVKIYQLRFGKASAIVEALRRGELLPLQYAKIDYDDSSNQIVALYNIGTLQRLQRIIETLDVEGAPLNIETFYLKYRDAETMAQIIVDLFSAEEGESEGGGGGIFGNSSRNRSSSSSRRSSRGSNAQQMSGVSTTANLRVTFDKMTNSITVRAEEEVIEQIRRTIELRWDVPFGTPPQTRGYDLEHSDVTKVHEMLIEMFAPAEEATSTLGPQDFFGGRGGGGRTGRGSSSSSDEGVKGIHRLAGQFSFVADESKNRLYVTAQSAEAMDYMDTLIAQIDDARSIDTPIFMELRYANAEEVATQLNIIFMERGGAGTLLGTETGLTGSTIGDESDNADGGDDVEAQELQFWWQSGRPDEDERPISSLIAQMRIVPIRRQNALLILAKPEHRSAIKSIVDDLDRPGRQVVLMATIAEASQEAITEIGLRWGSDRGIIDSANPFNQLNSTNNISGTKNNLFPDLFDVSTLTFNMDLNVVLSLLQEDTGSTVLSSPKLFTSDNEEAVFFDGQDIPFITDTQITDTGQTINSFEYRQVGIELAARPHITAEGNVDMHINLLLSSIVPGQTLFGGAVVDRRQTESRVTVRSGQTIVLSGILRSEDTEIVRKVPFLGDIPIIGPVFFRSKDRTQVHKEILAFITPIIVENPDAADEVFEKDNEFLDNTFQKERREYGGEKLLKDALRPDHWKTPKELQDDEDRKNKK